MKQIKVIVEKHADGYVAYPLGLKGIVVGEGDTYEGATESCQYIRPGTQCSADFRRWRTTSAHQT